MVEKYKLKLKHHFDAAHKLKLDYPSPCTELHGHRYEVIVEIGAERLDENGMIIDFSEIKGVINELDHKYLNEILDFNPTAENLASYLWEKILTLLTEKHKGFFNGQVRVTIYETPNASTAYG